MTTKKPENHMPEFEKQRTPLKGEVDPKDAKFKASQAALKYAQKFRAPKK